MIGARRIVLACALALGACGDARPESSTTSSAAVGAQRFAAGDVLRYRFDWRVDTSSDADGLLPDGMQLDAGIAFAGEIAMRVYPRTNEGAVIGVTFTRLDEHAITTMGQSALQDPSELLDREVLAVVDDEGEVRSIYFAADAPPLLKHLIPGLLAQADLRLPARDGAQQVPAGSGIADVEYAWSSPTRLARVLRGYSRFDAFAGETPPDADGRLEITLDEHGLPLRMEGDEVVSATDAREQQFRSRTSFAFERIDVAHGEAADAPDLTALVQRDPFAMPDTTEAERALAQRFAKGLTSADVELAVYAAASGLRPAPAFIVQATGRLRGWPELATELETVFADHDDPRARSLVIDMLASAGTPEAQTVMCRLLEDPALREHADYAAWLQRFAFLWRPQPGTARFLLDELALARDLGDSRTERALLYPMGTVARRIAAIDPIAASALRVQLRDGLAVASEPKHVIAAIGGLGNAGSAEDLPLVLAHEHDTEPGTRGAVASALRLQPGPEATAALLRLVADAEPFVAQVALTALEQRRIDEHGVSRLGGLALGGGYPTELADPLTSVLLRHIDDDPTVRVALLAMRSRTTDRSERERIDANLGAG